MKILIIIGAAFLAACAVEPAAQENVWTVPAYSPAIPHAPKLDGYRQLKSQAVEFRKYRVFHPSGVWTVTLNAGDMPIRIDTAGGESVSLGGEWYPEEGGADAAAVYGLTKGEETLIVIKGTSDLTYEETRVRFVGGKVIDTRRYAVKGEGMGPEMPGVEPKYRVYPPL